MKKVVEPHIPMTFWPHALVQMLAFVGYFFLLMPQGMWPSVANRLAMLEEEVGWSLPLLLWVVFVLLVCETCIRLSQRWAARIFPFRHGGFVGLQMLLFVPMISFIFVGLECVLFFVVTGHYPLRFGPIFFEQGFGLTLRADVGITVVMAVGELARHLLYGQTIRKWHHERGLRLLPQAASEASAD